MGEAFDQNRAKREMSKRGPRAMPVGIYSISQNWILNQALRLRSGQYKGSESNRTVENDEDSLS